MIRIVLDTNVIVSALVFGGLPRAVLELADAGRCQLFYSEAIQEEVRRVLQEKFDWTPARLQRSCRSFGAWARRFFPRMVVNAVPDDPDDNRILECAVEAQADFLISGDHHLLALRSFQSIAIVSPREFETRLRS